MLMESKSLLYHYSSLWRAPTTQVQRRLESCGWSLSSLQSNAHFILSTSLQKKRKHSQTSTPHASEYTGNKMQRANASLPFRSTVSSWVAWRRRIWPAWDLVLKTKLNLAYSPSIQDRILSVSQLRPQLSVAIPPSCGREWDSTWRGEQNAKGGAETSPNASLIQKEVRDGTKKRYHQTNTLHCLFVLCLSFRPSKTSPPTYPCPVSITFS